MASCFLYKRREFIALLGGAAAAWPLAARGQQQPKILRVGFVAGFSGGKVSAAVRTKLKREIVGS
jgi:putative tryptophan/tyrosine transport system substrate-binding protein